MPGFGRGGMPPGEGRGPAGALPPPRGPAAGRPSPGRAGRSPPGAPPGRGPDERCGAEPAPTPNGLLPTRGARGPGLGDWGRGGTTAPPDWPPACGPACGSCCCCGAGAAAAAAGCAAAGCGAASVSTLAAAGFGAGAGAGALGCSGAGWTTAGFGAGLGPAWGVACAGAGAASGCGRAAGFGRGPFLAPLLAPLLGYASRNLRATGASTVEDADFTNSPCSLSFARTSLLVTPSSFASSCTRALPATALLVRVRPAAWTRSTSSYCLAFMASASRLTHDGSTCLRSSSPVREDPGPVTR
jgi:hypothetical protein